LYDFIVGGTIKNLAKVFVKTSNLPQLKAKYTKMIAKMREDKFLKYYHKFYVVYTQLPADLRKDYVFTETITKQEVIAKIEHVDKRDLMKIISKVPSEFIVKQTKHYTSLKDQLPANGQMNETFLWRRIIGKI
jgi:ATP-dependent protease Clp ATPase subunit